MLLKTVLLSLKTLHNFKTDVTNFVKMVTKPLPVNIQFFEIMSIFWLWSGGDGSGRSGTVQRLVCIPDFGTFTKEIALLLNNLWHPRHSLFITILKMYKNHLMLTLLTCTLIGPFVDLETGICLNPKVERILHWPELAKRVDKLFLDFL